MQQEATLKRFLPTTNKITYVSAHPVQPWIAVADKTSGAQIWNWQSGEILYTAQFGGVDESAMHYHSLQKMAEVDPAYWGARVAQEQSVSKTPSGKLKMIEFLDVETLYWQIISQLSFTKGRSGEIMEGSVPGGAFIMKERWLVFVCENKILFHELLSHKSLELSKIALDSKNPNCIALLPGKTQEGALDDACIAIGCNDGTIRVVSFSSFKTVARLGYRSTPVTCLMALHTSPTATLLISGSQEGTLCLWDPFPTVGAAGGSLPPITTVSKAHDGEIISIAMGFSSPNAITPGIFTLGGDRAIAIYAIHGLKNLTKFRGPNQKLAFHSMDICQPLEAAPEKTPVILASQNQIHGTSVAGGTFTKLCDPSALLPSDLKKAPKMYHFVLHPLQRQLAILALSSGVMVVKIAVPYTAAAVALPVPRTPRQSLEVTCIRLKGQSMLRTEKGVLTQEGSDGGPARSIPETIMDRELIEISDIFGSGGHYQLALAPDASKLAVVRTDVNRFIILTNTGTTWIDAFDGQGSAVVWSGRSDKVAALDIPLPLPMQSSQKSMARLRSRTDSTQGISVDLPMTPSIKVYKMGSSQSQEVGGGGNPAVMLHGGPLLGITTAPPAGSNQRALTFYSWTTLQPCSNEMPSPDWLQWASSFDLCILAYPTHILTCQVGDRFQPLTSLPIKESVHGIWEGDLFYASTFTSVECVIIQRSKELHDNSVVHIQVVQLASFQAGPNWLTGLVETSGRAHKPRPIGHLSILSASKQKVWVMDTHGRPATIDLSYPGFLALTHAIDEEYSIAREAAVGKLSSDTLGQMLLTMGSKSAIEALKLPGLSLPLRLKTAIDARYLKHALVCLEAIVQGCRRPEAVVRLSEFRDTLKERLPTLKKTAQVASVSPFSLSGAPPSAPTDLTAAISGDTIDWDLPLRAFTEKPPKKLSVEVDRDVLELAIALQDAAVQERQYDVADAAATILIQHCNEARDGDLLVQLESRLSSREQTKRLKDLISLTEKAKKSCNGQLRGLVAAALSGDGTALTEALQDLRMS